MKIDFIGDIHGHALELVLLLNKLGYSKKGDGFAHPERKVVFVGDYIDRGPHIRETLRIVKSMVDSENAIALMGNHEYNAICFHAPAKNGGHLRKHEIKNVIQHYETLRQFQHHPGEYEDYLEWFFTLPLFHETDRFRAVHACWDHASIHTLKRSGVLDRKNCLEKSVLKKVARPDSEAYKAVETILKGKEVLLPPGKTFLDKDGFERKETRVMWWIDPVGQDLHSISFEDIPALKTVPIPEFYSKNSGFYGPNEIPVFFGHYWLKGKPVLNRQNVCCLDYSVAKKGKLVAYQFDGEGQLNPSKLVNL